MSDGWEQDPELDNVYRDLAAAGWPPKKLETSTRHWMLGEIDRAYRWAFLTILTNRHGASLIDIQRVTGRSKKGLQRWPEAIGWNILTHAMVAFDAAIRAGDIGTGGRMAAEAICPTLKTMRYELWKEKRIFHEHWEFDQDTIQGTTTKRTPHELVTTVCLWEMWKPYWKDAIMATGDNQNYMRIDATRRLCTAVHSRTGVRIQRTFAQLEALRGEWHNAWEVFWDQIEEDWASLWLNSMSSTPSMSAD